MNEQPPVVLLVDDEPESLFLTQRQLRRAGVPNRVLTFEGGRDVVDYLTAACRGQSPLPCLLLLDVKMPEMTGFDVLEWIRAQPALEHLRVVMLSSSDDPNDMKRARRLGAREYLLKYPAPETLARLVQSAACAGKPSPTAV
jgi:CheY-like chemotaxis protein